MEVVCCKKSLHWMPLKLIKLPSIGINVMFLKCKNNYLTTGWYYKKVINSQLLGLTLNFTLPWNNQNVTIVQKKRSKIQLILRMVKSFCCLKSVKFKYIYMIWSKLVHRNKKWGSWCDFAMKPLSWLHEKYLTLYGGNILYLCSTRVTC